MITRPLANFPFQLRECSLSLSLLLMTALLSPVVTSAPSQHGFRFKEYEEFHDVLHPLEHDALPKKDFKRIRAKSAALVKRGQAVVKLGVPPGTNEEKKEELTKELKKFDEALAGFRSAARRGTNAQLKTTYSAVHDSFEMLASLLR